MLTAFYRHSDGQIEELADRARITEALGDATSLIWMDFLKPEDADFDFLESIFKFHPLAMEDSRKRAQRPKIEEYDDYLFIVLHALPPDYLTESKSAKGLITSRIELHLFIGPNYVISLHEKEFEPITNLTDLIRKQGSRFFEKGSDLLLYHVMDMAVDTYFPVLEHFDDHIDDLEDKVFVKPDREIMNKIFQLKKETVSMRKMVGPMREIVNILISRDIPNITAESLIYFRDVYDHLIRIYDMIDSLRDLLSGALDVYVSSISNQLNEVMKRLTIFASIFMPITFITGVYGMNLAGVPFYTVLLVIVAVVGANLLWFRRNKWM